MQLNGLLDFESLAVDNLQGARAQGRDVNLAICRVDMEVHSDIFLALSIIESNLLDQSMGCGVKDTQATGARNEGLTVSSINAHFARIVNVTCGASPENLVSGGIHNGYGAGASLGHPHITGSFVISNAIGGRDLLTYRFGGSARGEVYGRELIHRCKARSGRDVPRTKTAGQYRRTAGGEGSEQGRGSRCVSQLVLAGQTLILGSAYAKVAALVVRVLSAGCCGQGGVAVSGKRRGDHSHRPCDDGKGAGDSEQLV